MRQLMELKALKILTIVSAGALIALVLHAGEPADLSWWPIAIPFTAWIVGPAVIPYFLARRIKRRWFVCLMLVFLALSSAGSAFLYYQAFVVSTSSTAALVMIFVPLYQWIALACVGLLSGGAVKLLTRRSSPE
jgi:hypothetical protein